MSKKLLVLSLLALSLAACGNAKGKKSPDDPSNGGGQGGNTANGSHLSAGDFKKRCDTHKGIINIAKNRCVAKQGSASIAQGQATATPVTITDAAHAGTMIRSEGDSNAIILLNGNTIGSVGNTLILNHNNDSGTLALVADNAVGVATSATAYLCYDDTPGNDPQQGLTWCAAKDYP